MIICTLHMTHKIYYCDLSHFWTSNHCIMFKSYNNIPIAPIMRFFKCGHFYFNSGEGHFVGIYCVVGMCRRRDPHFWTKISDPVHINFTNGKNLSFPSITIFIVARQISHFAVLHGDHRFQKCISVQAVTTCIYTLQFIAARGSPGPGVREQLPGQPECQPDVHPWASMRMFHNI